jgi:hypothetical protein
MNEKLFELFKSNCVTCTKSRRTPDFLRKTDGNYIFICLNLSCEISKSFGFEDALEFTREEALQYGKQMGMD